MEIVFAMKERIAIAMLGLAFAGCTQSRSASPVASRPVGMEPVPSIHETINRGLGDQELQKATLSDTRHPKWSGKFVPTRDPQTGAPAGGPQNDPSTATASAGGVPGAQNRTPAVLASPSSPPSGSSNLPDGANASTPAMVGGASAAALGTAVATRPTGDAPSGTASSPAGLPAVEEPRTDSPAEAPPPDTLPQAPALPPTGGPKAVDLPPAIVNPPVTRPTGGDPLLGPNPELMPAIDTPLARPPQSAAKPVNDPGQLPAGPASSAAPAQPPVAAPAELPLEGAPQAPRDPQPEQGSLSKPAPAPASPPPPATTGPGTASLDGPPATPPSRVGPAAIGTPSPRPADAAVKLASFNNANALNTAIDREWREAGRSAARVGDEVITLHDLVLNVKEQLSRNPPGRSLNREELNMVAKSVLAGLIERTLIVQEAKRVLKNPKQVQRLNEAADKFWRDEELPPMMRKFAVDNEFQLSQKLKEAGRSLEALRHSYHQEFVAQVYLEQKFSDRRKVELPEMLGYYQKHLHDKEFDRPATITWRELVVEKDKHPNPGDARRKAELLLARLQRGDDFAGLARAESEGPSRIRQEGGLMQTSPGSYAVEAVNHALASLPLVQISPVLEGPTSFHIVRVEARREAGPATFEEIQDQIRRRIMIEKLRNARVDFITKLRRDTLVSTIFDGTDSDPNRQQEE
jgi:parvulin-like peptidyl-prolyl isomerase